MDNLEDAQMQLSLFPGPGGTAWWGGGSSAEAAAWKSDSWSKDQEDGGGDPAAGGPKFQISEGESRVQGGDAKGEL